MSPKSTPFEAFEEIHKVFIDIISDNTTSLVQSGKYGAINTYDTTSNVFYVIMFILEAYTLQSFLSIRKDRKSFPNR